MPFGELGNESVVLRISQIGGPEMHENPQAVGLTVEIRCGMFLKAIGKRIRRNNEMREVVKGWQGFVMNDGLGLGVFPRCVPTTLIIQAHLRPS